MKPWIMKLQMNCITDVLCRKIRSIEKAWNDALGAGIISCHRLSVKGNRLDRQPVA